MLQRAVDFFMATFWAWVVGIAAVVFVVRAIRTRGNPARRSGPGTRGEQLLGYAASGVMAPMIFSLMVFDGAGPWIGGTLGVALGIAIAVRVIRAGGVRQPISPLMGIPILAALFLPVLFGEGDTTTAVIMGVLTSMGLIIATKMLIDPDFVLKDPPSTTDNGRP